MSSLVLVAVGFTAFFLGYKFYSKFVSQSIFEINKPLIPPSISMSDGIDYHATKKHILFGHHFTSIAGAAPIIGPCVAAYWGGFLHYFGYWLEQYLWALFMIWAP